MSCFYYCFVVMTQTIFFLFFFFLKNWIVIGDDMGGYCLQWKLRTRTTLTITMKESKNTKYYLSASFNTFCLAHFIFTFFLSKKLWIILVKQKCLFESRLSSRIKNSVPDNQLYVKWTIQVQLSWVWIQFLKFLL